jgi:hypothetical protein
MNERDFPHIVELALQLAAFTTKFGVSKPSTASLASRSAVDAAVRRASGSMFVFASPMPPQPMPSEIASAANAAPTTRKRSKGPS